jgi:hypothetical protein
VAMRTKRAKKIGKAPTFEEEIHRRFDSEWVLVEDPRTDKDDNLIGGRVVCHSRDRDVVYRTAVRLRLKDSATLYTGSIPEGTAVVL